MGGSMCQYIFEAATTCSLVALCCGRARILKDIRLGMRCAAHGICSNKRLKCCAAVWAEHGPLSAAETSWLEGCRAGGQFVPLNVAQCASASTILRAWILEEYSMSIGSHGTWEDP
ncbi:unnamed protein product [Cladocopium goreaui]|uniref:Uncharacterized protein n=1 Tax=Cladocopium goreaui TaxID=2562237 RepID=A0A9P1C6B6_9DINO|nr:unnamed protein product [Cladocopium goreaui]